MELIVVIAGMTAVTYLPRLLPLLATTRRRLSGWERRALTVTVRQPFFVVVGAVGTVTLAILLGI
ncbi:MAG: AzlD domain-containing protein [Spirochaetota bacterium]